MNSTKVFDRKQYLNLETFRKNGEGVKTPVWFVEEDGILYARTDANSGKIKRIRHNQHVQVAPCKMDGALLGEWIEAFAHEINGEDIDQKVDKLLGKKYGLMKTLFSLGSSMQGRKYTILKIKVEES